MSAIFVSYTSTDRDWAHWIATELKALGHTPHVHEWEIGKGADILNWMEQRHAAADHVLCVVSKENLIAPYSTLERNAAVWRAAKDRADFVLFVVVKPCALPALTAHFRRCELFDLPEDAARTRFHAFMTDPAPPEAAPFPGLPTAESNISIRVPHHFMGRDGDMAEIEAAMARFHGRAAITALHGIRGVGKTVLAAAYAETHRNKYRATWWIRAETPDTIRADLASLGYRLGWVAEGDKQDAALDKVASRLSREGEGILLIFDNAPDRDAIAAFLPRGGTAHVLITSNAHGWSRLAESVEIRLWPKEIGSAYLRARATRPEPSETAEALSEALDGLPLAHDMAASYCAELDLTLSAYHARFDATPAEVLDDADSAPPEYHDHLTVAKTFALAIEAAAQRHPAAEPLLVAAALLPPEPIPLFLFAEGRTELAEGLDATLEGRGLERAMAALRRFALVEPESIPDERDPTVTTDCIRLHRLIRLTARWRRDDAAAETVRRGLLAAVEIVYPAETLDKPENWPRARRLNGIAAAMLVSCGDPARVSAERLASLLNRVASYWQGSLGTYHAAMTLFARALAIQEKEPGISQLEIAVTLNNLAVLWRALENFGVARQLYARALAIHEQELGTEDTEVASFLQNLACVLLDEGDLGTAQQLFERALAINEKALDVEDPVIATNLHNLGALLCNKDDHVAARPMLQRALDIRKKVFGAEHLHTANTLGSLAGLLQDLGELDSARALFEDADRIIAKELAADHPIRATSLNNLAGVLQAQGDLAAARPLLERALEIREKVQGVDHSDTANSLNSLAVLLQNQGDVAAARPLYERALAICEKKLGAAHPTTVLVRRNLAALW